MAKRYNYIPRNQNQVIYEEIITRQEDHAKQQVATKPNYYFIYRVKRIADPESLINVTLCEHLTLKDAKNAVDLYRKVNSDKNCKFGIETDCIIFKHDTLQGMIKEKEKCRK